MLHLLKIIIRQILRPFVFIRNAIWKLGAALKRGLLGYLTILWGHGAALWRRLLGYLTILWGYGAQPHRRHYGLYNQGATCYLNSVLQVLVMTTEIHDRLDHDSDTDQQLKQIFELLKRKTCTTRTITAAFGITNVYEQRDAPECLEMILNKISRRASEVFQGELTHTTECSKGHSINEETNPFWTLPLSLQDTHDTTYSVERSFERIFHLKSFSGDNMVYCNECEEKTEATCGCEMVKYPQILTLLLKRFDFDYRTMSYFKSHRCVDVPRTLQRKDKEYRLYGMVHHMGSLRGGHYTATILCSEDNTWYEFNDDHVSKVRWQPFAKTSPYKSETAYLLMYRANSESLADDAQPNQDETRKLNDLKPDHGERRSVGERDTDNGKQNEEDDVLMKIHEASGHQAGGEEDVAPAAQKRGPQNMSNDLTVKAKKSKLTDDAAEQDKTATECQSPSETKSEDLTDEVKEQQGEDTLKEQQGEDTLKDQQGEDTLKDQQGEDTLKEQQGEDTLKDQQGEDTLKEQQGEDTLKDQLGEDTLKEQQDEDTLKDQQGEDTLKEQQGEDKTEDKAEATRKDENRRMQHSEEDAAEKSRQSGSKKKSSWNLFKGKKSKVPDDAAEQDKTGAAQKRGQSGSKKKSSWNPFSCMMSRRTYDAAE